MSRPMLRLLATSVLISAIGSLAASCGGNGGDETSKPTALPSAVATQASGRTNEDGGIIIASGAEPTAFDIAPDGRLFFTERQTGEIRVASIRATSLLPEIAELPPVEQAVREMAELANVDISDVDILFVTDEEWPDSCLGLAEPGEACAEIVTPGHEVVVSASGMSGAAVFRTDEDTHVRFDRLRAAISGSELFASVDVFRGSECGLLGIAVDPEFETNGHLYIYATQPVEGDATVGKPRVIRFTDVDGVGTDPTVIVGDLPNTNPVTCAHVGGNLHFGPDGYLYLSVGNNERPNEAVAADLSSPLGKILRMNKEDGSAAPDNPFVGNPNADPRVFAYGLRNPWDFAFHPQTGKIYAPDNGPGNCDELNLIQAGSDYGVPGSLPVATTESCIGLGGVDPIYLFSIPGLDPTDFGSNLAPAGVAYLGGELYPTLGEGLLVCHFNSGEMQLLALAGPAFETVESVRRIANCRPNVEVWNGRIYYIDGQNIFELPPEAFESE